MRISDWSSDVCSSDLNALVSRIEARIARLLDWPVENGEAIQILRYGVGAQYKPHHDYFDPDWSGSAGPLKRGGQRVASLVMYLNTPERGGTTTFPRSEEHTSELQSLMRNSYDVFCLKKKKTTNNKTST